MSISASSVLLGLFPTNCTTNTSSTDLRLLTGSLSRMQSPLRKWQQSALSSRFPLSLGTMGCQRVNLVTFLWKSGPSATSFRLVKSQSTSGSTACSSVPTSIGNSTSTAFLGLVGLNSAICLTGLVAPWPLMLSQPVMAFLPFCLLYATSWYDMFDTSNTASRFLVTLMRFTSFMALSSQSTSSALGWSSRQQLKAKRRSSMTSSWQSRQSPWKQNEANMLKELSLREVSLPNCLRMAVRKGRMESSWASQLVWKKWKRSLVFSMKLSLLQAVRVWLYSCSLRKLGMTQCRQGCSNFCMVCPVC